MIGRVLLAVALVLAAGCSDDADQPGAAPGSTSVPDPPTTTSATTTSAPASTSVPASTSAPSSGRAEVRHGSLVTRDGRTRTYRLHLPAERAPDAPLVLALHGGTGNGDQLARSSGYDELSEAEGFVVAYPDGTPTARGERRLVWNAGGCCARAAEGADDVDDVAFLVALVEEVAAAEDLDPTRVLVTGHSNGAMMALRLACEAADHVAAVAVQAGTVFVDDCAPTRPVSVMDLHGTEDRNLPLGGGVGEESLVGADFPPVRQGLGAFARAAGCDGAGAPTTRDGDRPDVTIESWGPCPDGVDVELVAVAGAGHAWLDDASRRTWAFLAAHRG